MKCENDQRLFQVWVGLMSGALSYRCVLVSTLCPPYVGILGRHVYDFATSACILDARTARLPTNKHALHRLAAARMMAVLIERGCVTHRLKSIFTMHGAAISASSTLTSMSRRRIYSLLVVCSPEVRLEGLFSSTIPYLSTICCNYGRGEKALVVRF